ncbi:MAG: glucose-1-phosphate thymidylyltransferase [Candidatus Diapherotrites archaeon]
MDEEKPRYWDVINMLDKLELRHSTNKAIVEENVFIRGSLLAKNGVIIKAGTYIDGNVYIGKNSVIGPNVYLRGNVIIADNCKISSSEIKNSILLSGARVPHFSYVGDSILGHKVNMGAGAKIANLRMDGATVKVDLFGNKIDSKRKKLGALIKDYSSIGINAAINCGVIIGKKCIVFPGTFVRKSFQDKMIIC